MNAFDSLRDSAFDTVATTMGYTCIWAPAAGGEEQTATVLYKDATEEQTLNGMQFTPYRFSMEWRKPFLPGLKESVDAGVTEFIGIVDKGNYLVRSVETLFDGINYKAHLEKQ